MEFVAGRTLQQKLDETGPLDLPEVLRIGRQIASGLAASHANDLIHRDIKPSNIMLEDGAGRVKITDFGLARAADDASITQSGFIAGTPMYMAPEQANGDPLDQRADLFSLGSVLYTMCSGRPPFRPDQHVRGPRTGGRGHAAADPEIIPETPQWLCDLITELHAKKPENRIATAEEVAVLLASGPEAMPRPARVPSLPVVAPVAVEKVLQEDRTPAERGTPENPRRRSSRVRARAAGQPPRPCSCCSSAVSASRKRTA